MRQQQYVLLTPIFAAAKEHVLNSTTTENQHRLMASLALAGIFIVSAAQVSAQTKLTASQLPTIQGAAQGPASGTTLRDVTSAADYAVNQTGGIAGAISACGATVSCSILIPPSYTLSDPVPGYWLDPNNPQAATTPGNVTIFDQRYGDARMAVNPRGYTDGLISSPNGWVYNYYAKQPANAILSPLLILENSWDGGTNLQNSALGYFNKNTYMPLYLASYSHTPGQHLGMNIVTKNYSIGDDLGLSNYVTCWGGFNAQADEGCEAQDNQVFMGNVAFEGNLTGTPATGATSVTINPTQGGNTQGAGRFLIRLSSGTITSGAISGITTTGTALTTITGSGTSWPISKAIAQLGTNVSAPGSITVTPASFSVGSMTQITTSSLVCVADPGAFEMVYPSAAAATTFTATFTKAHPSSATIATGGVCGYLLDLTADDVTDSTFTTKIQSITGTLRFPWPAVSSTAAGSLQLYVAAGGSYQQLASRWDASAANGYVLYPAAEVVSVQQNGGVSNTLTLGPNNVAWTAGDLVEEPIYPAAHFAFSNNVIESYYPNSPTSAGGFAIEYNTPLHGSDVMLRLDNNAPISMYTANGGKYTAPVGIHIGGETNYGLFFDRPGDSWTIGVGCTTNCNTVTNILAAANSSGYDYLQYDEANQRWIFSANNNASHYTFGATQMLTPFSNVSMSSDSAGTGYVATYSLRSGSAGNTDLSGELTFGNSTSASYTFQGGYSSHAECWVEPQFDIGSGNRYWITYTGTTSMTVNFASVVTGTASYGCVGRN